jgi:endogenous inhibitor of DNA gyrase (YacG/DUF329 family)
MVDPTSDLGEDVDESDAPTCANCGDPIVQSATHRVVTWVEDGAVRHRHFCSDDCRDASDG